MRTEGGCSVTCISGGRCRTVDKLKDQEGQVMSSAGTGTRQRQMKTKQSSAFSLKTIWAGVCVQEFPEWTGERTEKGVRGE